jgi:Leucine-rich repeat (LRR) protein
MIPPIDKMDPAILNNLVKCTKLSLSSNNIDKISNLPNLKNLEILSLARNNIKKISGLDEMGIYNILLLNIRFFKIKFIFIIIEYILHIL